MSSTKTSSSEAARRTASSGTAPSSARSEPTIAIAGPAGRTRRPRASAVGPHLGEAVRRRVDLGGLAAGVLGDQLGRAAAADDLAVRHHRDLVGQPLGLLDVVGRHQDRRAARAQVVDQRPELGADLRVEADGRLVEQDQPRFVDQAAGEQQAAAHAAGELVDGVAATVAQARQVERPVDRGADVGDPVEAGEDGQVVLDGDVDVEVVELRHDAHLGAGRLGVAGQLVAERPQLARVGQRLPGQQPHRRRLAGAVRPEQAEADALGHVEVEPVDRRDRAEPLDHAAQFDRRHGGHACMEDSPPCWTSAGSGPCTWRRCGEEELHAEREPHVLFQASTIGALLDGAYEGDLSFAELAEHGDLGLGTLNGLDGEMIAIDGRFYRADVDGAVDEVDAADADAVRRGDALRADDRRSSSTARSTTRRCWRGSTS